MAKTFSDISKTIIDEAIEKVLYVDNEIALPFRTENKLDNYEFCSKLFTSFKSNNSFVDFYEFKDFSEWNGNVDFFKGTDLLILDWKLDDESEFGFESALKILDSAIRTDSLHFVNIYSSEKKSDLEDIPFFINAFYSGITPEKKKVIYQELHDYLDNEGINTDDFFNPLKDLSIRLNKEFKTQNRGEIFKDINNWLKESFANETRGFNSLLIRRFKEKNLLKCYCKLAYILNDCVLSDKEKSTFSSDLISNHFLFLNHTIIQISQKAERPPQEFYEGFRKAIIESTKNYLTIMGLEMRNRFRKSSAFIGKDIDQISDLAFFFHKEHNNNSKASFYAFMKDIWKDQAASFLYSKEMDLEIFKVLEDYEEANGINEKIEKEREKGTFNDDLALLNYYYNCLTVERNLEGKIKFGDVFSINENFTEFLLCITAHCDCVHPDKIGDSLFFVKGNKGNIQNELKEGDEGFNSYLVDDKGKPFVIKWTDKPVTIHIPPQQNVVGNIGEVSLHGNKVNPIRIATIKDNYTQRIANRAFSYPMRVGIFFADRKDLSE